MALIIILTWMVGSFGILVCFIYNRHMCYWKDNGVPHLKPILFFGNMLEVIFGEDSWTDVLQRMYNKIPGDPRYFGFYDFYRPTIMLKDPRLLKSITVDDFEHFAEHHVHFYKDRNQLWNHSITFLKGDKWKEMRAAILSFFTPAKLRIFTGFMDQTAVTFAAYLETFDTTSVDMKDAFSKCTLDFIAMLIFGTNVNSLENNGNTFLTMSKKIWNVMGERSPLPVLKIHFRRAFPWLTQKMKLSCTPKECDRFVRDLINSTIKTREEQGFWGDDLLTLLMTAQDNETGAHELDLDDITAQAYTFIFLALPLTISMSYMAYEIAKNPEVQEKLQREIDGVLFEGTEEIDIDAIQNMRYLEMVLCESLRIHPPTGNIVRTCTKTYTLPPAFEGGRAFTVPVGMPLYIPVYSVHMDKNNFPNPEIFYPERFSEENIEHLTPFTYFPWGGGPKMCIAKDYVKLQIKLIFVHLLKRFTFTLPPEMKMKNAMKFNRNFYYTEPNNGFRLHLQRRTS